MTATAYPALSQGADPPGLCAVAGGVLMLAGAVFGAANLFQFGVMSGLSHLSPAALSMSWPAALVVFFVGLARVRAWGGESGRRATAWSRLAIGVQIGLALALLAAGFAIHDFTLMFWTAPIGLTTYGVGWAIAAWRGGGRWMAAPALGCLSVAVVLTSLLGTPGACLAYAAGLFSFVLLPGAWLALACKS